MEGRPEGWRHVETAIELLSAIPKDLFHLPEAAVERIERERPDLGKPHPDDLLCGCWAAATAASALLEMMGRHIDAVLNLAELHAAFASPAQTLARAVMEQGMRVAWLLDPATATDREQRWFAIEKERLRFMKAVGGMDAGSCDAQISQLDEVAKKMPGLPVPGIPSIEALSKSFSPHVDLYQFYRFLSQPIHGTTFGSGTFDYANRHQWNADGGDGEWVEAEFWNMPLVVMWDASHAAMIRYRDLLAPGTPLSSLDHYDEFILALSSVPPNFQARKDIERRAREGTPRLNREQRRAATKRRQK
jgi:hypothetical protein